MLRIRFTERDLTRVTFSTADHAETLGSVRALLSGPGTGWRARTARRITGRMLPLLEVVGDAGEVPDFLTPEGVSGGTSADVAGMLHTVPVARIADDLGRAGRTGSPWLRRL
ncbi:MAG TPA: hypothetical protein VGD67_25930, partial [Pseudonocardiaceae bacterium]